MTKFEEVAQDIIDQLTKIHYSDKDKKIIHSIVLYNLYMLTKDEEHFNQGIEALKKLELKNNTKPLN